MVTAFVPLYSIAAMSYALAASSSVPTIICHDYVIRSYLRYIFLFFFCDFCRILLTVSAEVEVLISENSSDPGFPSSILMVSAFIYMVCSINIHNIYTKGETIFFLSLIIYLATPLYIDAPLENPLLFLQFWKIFV